MLRRPKIFAALNRSGTTGRMQRTLRDQRGFALILALSMLAILSILGAMVLSNSGTDISVTTNFQGTQQAFYAVDRAVEYGTSRSLLLAMPSMGSIDLATGAHKVNIDQGGDADAGSGEIIAGTVGDLGPGDIPTKLSAIYGSDFGANFYRVSGTGLGPNNSQVRVEATIIRLFKNEDESIFVTTGGG